jgi:pyrroloquinoline quinone biosynthesis protein B
MADPRKGVEVLLLGAAQDGGVPHIGCNCSNCKAAKDDPDRRRQLAVSLAVLDYDAAQFWLVDCT